MEFLGSGNGIAPATASIMRAIAGEETVAQSAAAATAGATVSLRVKMLTSLAPSGTP